MSSTLTRPAWPRPGSIQSPGLAAWKVDGHVGAHGERPRPRRSRRRRRSARRPRAPARAGARSPRSPRRSRRAARPSRPVPSSASITSDGARAAIAGAERQRRRPRAGARGWRGRRPELAGLAGEQHLDLAAALAQQPRGDEPVAAVVALARRRPRSGPPAPSAPPAPATAGAGALHQLERGHAALADRPGVDRAHLRRRRSSGSSQPGASPQHRHRARHPARVGQRDADLDAELAGARSRAAPCSARPTSRAAAEHLDVERREDRHGRAPCDTASLAQKRAARCCAGRAARARVVELAGVEEPPGEARAARERALDPLDLEQVEPDPGSSVAPCARGYPTAAAGRSITRR